MPATWRERLLYWWTCFLVLFKAPVKPASVPPAAADAHPCSRCQCSGGPDLPPDEHRPDCEWAGVMCLPCKGLGRCVQCGGFGVRPSSPDPACPSLTATARRMATQLRRSAAEMDRWQQFFSSDAPATAAALLDDYANLDDQLQRALAKLKRLKANNSGSQHQGDLAP